MMKLQKEDRDLAIVIILSLIITFVGLWFILTTMLLPHVHAASPHKGKDNKEAGLTVIIKLKYSDAAIALTK